MIKIAIVDDEELIRRGISYLLEEAKRSYQVVGMFENGQKALDFLMNYDVDVIITDISYACYGWFVLFFKSFNN